MPMKRIKIFLAVFYVGAATGYALWKKYMPPIRTAGLR
jgi:hypothetical protein